MNIDIFCVLDHLKLQEKFLGRGRYKYKYANTPSHWNEKILHSEKNISSNKTLKYRQQVAGKTIWLEDVFVIFEEFSVFWLENVRKCRASVREFFMFWKKRAYLKLPFQIWKSNSQLTEHPCYLMKIKL